MIHFKISLFCVIVFLSCSAEAQTADQVIKSYVKSIGGKKAWMKVKTMTTAGEYDYGGIVFPFSTYAKAPDLYKFVVRFNGKYYAQSFDGTSGWKIDAFKNETTPTLLTGKDALAMANESDVELVSAFVDYQQKGHQARVTGTDSVQGKKCITLHFTRKNGETEDYYFDAQTSELIMKIAPSKNVELGRAPLSIHYSDYRDVDGIRIPFKTICESGGQMILTITISNAAINSIIEDKSFQFDSTGTN